MTGDQQLQINSLLREYLSEDSEAYEVAQYCMTNEALIMAASVAKHNPELKGIDVPPESLLLMADYHNKVVNNTFYHRHFNAITVMMSLSNIRDNSKAMHLLHSMKDPASDSSGIVRELTANRFNILTAIVLWEKGVEEAKKFDFFLKQAVKFSDQERRYFDKHGVK